MKKNKKDKIINNKKKYNVKNNKLKKINNIKNNKNIIIMALMSISIVLLIILVMLIYKNNDKKIYDLNTKLDNLNIKYNKVLEQNNKFIEEKKNNQKKDIDIYKTGMATKVPIITFHRTVDSETKKKYFSKNKWVNDLSVVGEQLKYLYDNGWKTIDLDEFYCWYNKECEFPIKTFIITIDDGDSEVYYNILPLLEKYNFKATMFAIGKYIPETTEKLSEPKRLKLGYDKILELRKNKSLLQIESHTYDLHYLAGKKKAVLTKTAAELKQDFINNEKYEFNYLAYPYGVYNRLMLNATANSKIKMAFGFSNFTYATRLDNKYEVARFKVDANMKLNEFKKIFEYAKGE